MATKKTITAKSKATLSPNYIKCSCCGTEKTERYFYKSNADVYANYGRLPVCKECVR